MPRHAALVLLIALIAAAPTAPGQTPRKVEPATVEFDADPCRLESIGLTFLLPVGTRAETTRIGPQATIRINPTSDAQWAIDVQTVKETPSDTVETVANKIAEELRASVGIRDDRTGEIDSRAQELLREKNLILPGGVSERFYMALPQGPGQPRMVRGYTVFATGPGSFVSFTLFALEPEFTEARRIYEAMVATAAIEDPAHVAAEREAAVRSGAALLARLSDEDHRQALRAIGGWQRLWLPASTGTESDAEELGYRRIVTWLGRRGDIDRTDRGEPKDSDNPEGYVVRFEARLLHDKAIIDTVGAFFLSFDGEDEAWLIRLARREGEARHRYSETGARHAESMVVTVRGDGKPAETFKPIIEGEGYLNQAQVYLLPHMLVKKGIGAEFAFYCYQSSLNLIKLRRDTLERADDGVWRLTTRPSEDMPAQVSLYDADGMLIRSELGDGRVWEPITLERLASIWRRKGLPME